MKLSVAKREERDSCELTEGLSECMREKAVVRGGKQETGGNREGREEYRAYGRDRESS